MKQVLAKRTGEITEKAAAILMETLARVCWHGDDPAANPWEACFCALAATVNPPHRAEDIVEAFPAHGARLDRFSFLNTMANLGFFMQAENVQLCAVEARLMPCVFVPSSGGVPCVLLSRNEDGIEIYDGAQRSVRIDKISSKKEGRAWFFQFYDHNMQPTSKFLRGGTGFSWFRALLGRFYPVFLQVFFSGLFLNIVALAAPLFIMFSYDHIISPADLSDLPAVGAGVVLALVLEYILRQARSKGLSFLSARMDNIVGNKIFAHLVGLPPELIERASVAAQIARIKTFEAVRDVFSGSVFLSCLEVPYVIISLLLIGAIAGPLVMVPLGMMVLYTLLFVFMRNKVKSAIRLAAKASSARQQFTIETFEKLPGIRSNGLSAVWGDKFEDISGRENIMNFRLNWLGTVSETLAHALTVFSAILTVGVGAHLIWAGEMTTGAMIASMILVWRVLTPFYSMCAMIPRLEQLRNSILQVNDLMDIDTEAEAARSAARLPRLRGHVSFNAVALRYSLDEDPVFTGLSFDAAPGNIIAITGKNGAGKSSVLKMIKGMYRAQSGAVRIDGFDIRQLDALELRRQIAYVPQAHEFSKSTVAEFLRAVKPLATEGEMEKALMRADAWHIVQKMDGKLAAMLIPGQIGDGFAARLALARAYLHDGKVFLLDELPNSLLNGQAGDNLRQWLKEQMMGRQRTVVLVSHREDMLDLADTVVHLRKGEMPRLDKSFKPTNVLRETA